MMHGIRRVGIGGTTRLIGSRAVALIAGLCGAGLTQVAAAQQQAGGPDAWPARETNLRDPIQLTTRDRFLKAGEAYFSSDGRWIIFQAIAAPPAGSAADPAAGYAMYVAPLERDRAGDGRLGAVRGMGTPIKISPDGSINTCGWFHPTAPGRVLFGSTITTPSAGEKPGFQVGTNRYVWAFPEQMEVVETIVEPVFREQFARIAREAERNGVAVDRPAQLDTSLRPLFARPGYDAEASYSPDGRYVLYAHVEPPAEGQEPDADLWVFDTLTQQQTRLIGEKGYDGGPFFSPDGQWICYRSDRKGDDKLQIFVAELKFEGGAIVGIEREYQITDDGHVNWCPYWHSSGAFLLFASSAAGHSNYEVYMAPVDREALKRGEKPSAPTRITHAPGADVLPAFSADGRLVMWTSQRGPKADDEQRPSSQLWVAEWIGPGSGIGAEAR